MTTFFLFAISVLVLSITFFTCIGCSKGSDSPKPGQIHWSAPDTGYQADSGAAPPESTGTPKEP
jgi:hypothetical protein